MSVGFFVDEGTPVIWRGPMLHKMLQQFINGITLGVLQTFTYFRTIQTMPSSIVVTISSPDRRSIPASTMPRPSLVEVVSAMSALAALTALWRLWRPQAAAYRQRALDPSAAPSYGVPGNQ